MAISSVLGSSALLPAGLGFRNVIINGGFDIWQRGTAATTIAITSSSAFLADRWQATRSVSGSKQSQISAGLDGFRYGMRIQRDSGNTSTTAIYLSQSFEGDVAIKLANKPVVLSFYARAGSNYSPTSSFLTVGLGCGTGSEANIIYSSFTGYTLPVNSNITLTTSWQRFTFIVNIPSGTTQAGLYFAMTPVGTASTNDYFDITGVQLEQNYQPTPFEQRPIGIELALCQRYYEKTYDSGTAPGTASTQVGMVGNDVSSSGNTNEYIICRTRYQVQKRVAPTITAYDGAGNSGKATRFNTVGQPTDNTNVGIDQIGEKSFRMYIGTGLANNAGFTIHYTASAEL
jgi:hypothetical protein